MTPEVFALWAPVASIDEVLQVCDEARFADDPIVRALVGLLERENYKSRLYEDVRTVVRSSVNAIFDEDKARRLREKPTDDERRGVNRLAYEVEDFLERLSDDTPISEIRGSIENIARGLCESPHSLDLLRIGAVARNAEELKVGRPRGLMKLIRLGQYSIGVVEQPETAKRPRKSRYREAILDELRLHSKTNPKGPGWAINPRPHTAGLKQSELVERVNKKLGKKTVSTAVYAPLKALVEKGEVVLDADGFLHLG